MVHNTAQNSSENFSSYLPDNHHSSDNCLWEGWAIVLESRVFYFITLSMFFCVNSCLLAVQGSGAQTLPSVRKNISPTYHPLVS